MLLLMHDSCKHERLTASTPSLSDGWENAHADENVLSYLTSQNIAVITLKHFFRMSLEGPAIRTAIVTKEKCEPAGREFVSVPV